MQTIRTIGLDIAKSVFQVHGVDAAGQAVNRGTAIFSFKDKVLRRSVETTE